MEDLFYFPQILVGDVDIPIKGKVNDENKKNYYG
jgi:hypothetical protein